MVMVSTKKIVAAAIIIVTAIAFVYVAFTFPKAVIDFNVVFTVGADREMKEFEVSLLHDKVQVEVTVKSGSALWTARIADSKWKEIWSHSAAQGDQTTYRSDWLSLPSARYNFTFGTIGLGGLEANIIVASKGGFW
jgi:hypothetical protein